VQSACSWGSSKRLLRAQQPFYHSCYQRCMLSEASSSCRHVSRFAALHHSVSCSLAAHGRKQNAHNLCPAHTLILVLHILPHHCSFLQCATHCSISAAGGADDSGVLRLPTAVAYTAGDSHGPPH
jgi:hypothetical protein